MTHIICVSEGFPNGINHFIDSVRKHCVYTLKDGAPDEIGLKAGVTFREIRFWDATLKQDTREQFLGEVKPYVKRFNEDNVEALQDYGKGHGVDEKGFKIGVFRKMFHYVLKQLNLKPIDMNSVKETPNLLLNAEMKKLGMHGNFMILGELPDSFEPSGREHS